MACLLLSHCCWAGAKPSYKIFNRFPLSQRLFGDLLPQQLPKRISLRRNFLAFSQPLSNHRLMLTALEYNFFGHAACASTPTPADGLSLRQIHLWNLHLALVQNRQTASIFSEFKREQCFGGLGITYLRPWQKLSLKYIDSTRKSIDKLKKHR